MEQQDSFWYRLVTLDPVVFRTAIVGIVTLLADLGVVISPSLPDAIVGLITTVGAIVTAVWARNGVTPNAKVAVIVPDPVNNPHIVEAGEAIATAPNKEIIEAATMNPKPT